jgi:hypothetical protein
MGEKEMHLRKIAELEKYILYLEKSERLLKEALRNSKS